VFYLLEAHRRQPAPNALMTMKPSPLATLSGDRAITDEEALKIDIGELHPKDVARKEPWPSPSSRPTRPIIPRSDDVCASESSYYSSVHVQFPLAE
jgi:hypothetical protein